MTESKEILIEELIQKYERPWTEVVSEGTMKLLEQVFAELQSAGIDQALLEEIGYRFFVLGKREILANINTFIEETQQEKLRGVEALQRFYLGYLWDYDFSQVGVGVVSEQEQEQIVLLATQADYSNTQLARIFKRAEREIQQAKRRAL